MIVDNVKGEKISTDNSWERLCMKALCKEKKNCF